MGKLGHSALSRLVGLLGSESYSSGLWPQVSPTNCVACQC